MHENKNYTPLKISSTQCKFENGKVAISTAFKVKLQQIRESTVIVGRLPHSHFQCTALSFVKHGQKCKIKVISPNVTE